MQQNPTCTFSANYSLKYNGEQVMTDEITVHGQQVLKLKQKSVL